MTENKTKDWSTVILILQQAAEKDPAIAAFYRQAAELCDRVARGELCDRMARGKLEACRQEEFDRTLRAAEYYKTVIQNLRGK